MFAVVYLYGVDRYEGQLCGNRPSEKLSCRILAKLGQPSRDEGGRHAMAQSLHYCASECSLPSQEWAGIGLVLELGSRGGERQEDEGLALLK